MLSTLLQTLGGPGRVSWRRPAYVLAILGSADALCYLGHLTGGEWVAVAMALVTTGVAGEVAPKMLRRRPAVEPSPSAELADPPTES